MTLLAMPAEALPVTINYSFTYRPPPDFPGGSTLSGELQFYSEAIGVPPSLTCGGPIALGPLFSGVTFSDSFSSSDPCFADPGQELLFRFTGSVMPGSVPVYAFPGGDPLTTPPTDPIFLGPLDFDV